MYGDYFNNKRAVLFDLDGTIVDSLPYWTKAVLSIVQDLNGYGFDVNDVYLGISLETIWGTILNKPEQNIVAPQTDLIKKTNERFLEFFLSDDVVVRDGFWELLHDIKNNLKLPVGLVTNSSRQTTTQVLERLSLKSVFDLTITGDEVSNRKPDPQIFNDAAKKLKISPKDMLVFEDSVSGVNAALASGVETVIVIWDSPISKHAYPLDKVNLFLPDFINMAGNLQKDNYQRMVDAVAVLEKEQKEREKQKPKK